MAFQEGVTIVSALSDVAYAMNVRVLVHDTTSL